MKERFVPYYEITDTAETLLKWETASNIYDAISFAIQDLGHDPVYYAFAEFGVYKAFVDPNKELSEASEDWQWEPDLFGLCTFASQKRYLDFLKFCDER